MPLDLPFDVEEVTYQSCIGRQSGGFINGIYTSGTVRGKAQLACVPLFNLTGNAAPMPTRLILSNGDLVSAIAPTRNRTTTETDLYAIGGSTLFRWGADEQVDNNSLGK